MKLNLKEREWIATWLLKQKPNNVVFLLFILFLPTQVGIHFWPNWALASGLRVDYFSPTVYLTDVFVFSLLTLNVKEFVLFVKKNSLVFVVLLAFAILNSTFAISHAVTIYKWARVLELGFLVWWIYRNKETILKKFSTPLIIGLSYSFLIGALQFLLGHTTGDFYLLGERTFNTTTPGIALVNILGKNFLRAYATFPHPNVLGGFSAVSFLLILLFAKKGRVKTFGLLVALLNVFLSFSLGAMTALAVSVLVYLTGFDKFVHRQLRQIIVCFVIVSIIAIPASRALFISNLDFPEKVSQRLLLSAISGEEFSQRPVLGVGEGNFISYIPKAQVKSNLWLLQPVHNIFELVLSETGLFGLILFLILLLKIKVNKESFLILLPILITGLFDHYWLTLPQTSFLFAIVVGILF